MRPHKSGAQAASNGRTKPEPEVVAPVVELVTDVLPPVDEVDELPADVLLDAIDVVEDCTELPRGPVPLLLTAGTAFNVG